jgi:hypothetical protein
VRRTPAEKLSSQEPPEPPDDLISYPLVFQHRQHEQCDEKMIVHYYEIMRAYIVHEDDLINSRLTWSLTITGFLVAAYALLAGKVTDLLADKTAFLAALASLLKEKPGSPSITTTVTAVTDHLRDMHVMIFFLLLAMIAVAVVGAVVTTLSYLAIFAAHQSIASLTSLAKHGLLEATGGGETIAPYCLPLPRVIGGGAPIADTHGRAGAYYLEVPRWLTRVWTILLLIAIGFLIYCILTLNSLAGSVLLLFMVLTSMGTVNACVNNPVVRFWVLAVLLIVFACILCLTPLVHLGWNPANRGSAPSAA